jgi:hypothetical protein
MANIIGTIMSKITASLGSLKDRSARLAAQRGAAKTALDKAKAAVQAHLLEGDDDAKTLAVLQAKVNDAFSLLESLDAAITEQARRVADAERQLADEATQAARKAASEALARDVDAIEAQLAPWLASTRTLAAALAKFETFRFESGSISKYLANASNEVEIALSVTVPDLKGGVTAVRDGREQAPSPAPILKVVAQKPPPTETVFFLRHAKYTDEKGMVRCLGKMRDHTLPPPLAQRALKSGAAIPLTDPRVRTLKGNWGMIVPGPDQCEALDGTPDSRVAPVLHSAFEVVDRGAPITGTLPVQRAPMVAARNLPTTTPED